MHLPLLALMPTDGTNDDEAGGSNAPLRPTPAAAGVMDEALGLPELEIVRTIKFEQRATLGKDRQHTRTDP